MYLFESAIPSGGLLHKMRTLTVLICAFLRKLAENKKIVLLCWFGFAIYGAVRAITAGQINNYLIFKHVYEHVLDQTNLYILYPGEYQDVNLYGPFFSLLIAPFSWLPDKAGSLLWAIANALFLFFAIARLPLPDKWKNTLLLLSAGEIMTTSHAMQANALVCACILLGFSYTRKGKEIWALFFIMAAAFIKLYGIAGLAFFFFSKRKRIFLLSAMAWSVVLFFAPVVITSFIFLIQSYADWYEGLQIKAAKNILLEKEVLYQNISLPGMIRRIFGLQHMQDKWILLPGFLCFISQYRQYKYINDIRYQLYLLCSVLLSVVLFSTGSESATYIIVLPGMILWYLLQRKTKWLNMFFLLAFLFTSFTYSDLFTPWARVHLSKPYSLKAFFPFVIWIVILIQIHARQFLKAIPPFLIMKLSKA